MAFFNSAVGVLQTLVIALGAGLGIWGFIAYRCIKKTDLGNTAYEAYLKEIEWALSNGTEVIGAP